MLRQLLLRVLAARRAPLQLGDVAALLGLPQQLLGGEAGHDGRAQRALLLGGQQAVLADLAQVGSHLVVDHFHWKRKIIRWIRDVVLFCASCCHHGPSSSWV